MAFARPFQIALLLCLTTASGYALQIGETSAQISERHGAPATEDHARQRAVYRWSGWSAELEFQDGVVGQLTYQTSHALTDAEIQSLLQANGGVDHWRETTGPGAAAREWRRDDQAFAEQTQPTGMVFRLRASVPALPAETLLTESFQKADVSPESAAAPKPLLRTSAELRPEPAVPAPSIVVAEIPAPVIAASPAPATGAKSGGIGAFIAAASLLAGGLLIWKKAAFAPAPVARPHPAPRPAAAPEPTPNAAHSASLAALREDQIALLLGEIFRREGYTVEISAALGGDDGNDLTLRRDGESIPVRSKDWKDARVSEQEVREFYGLMAGTAAPRGILVTTGTITRNAREFAADKSIDLIDRAALDRRIAAIRRPAENFFDVPAWIDDFTSTARIFDPECPCCGQAMAIRRHPTEGTDAWVCASYPRCSGKRAARPDLLTLPVAA
ncbi:MAG: restriction endonuclease [Chthoniobacter sp.]|nr:restriction endonuclease [Chthoniobacter sp.]